MEVEEDDDEIFTPISTVKCCLSHFDGETPVYFGLVPVERFGHTYMCCANCGGSYGETPT